MSTAATQRKHRRPMSKSFKGVLALGVAALLLLGGYGSYALWTSSVSLDGGAVNAGQLKLLDATEGEWRDVSDGAPGTAIPDIDEFLVVPGDQLTFSSSATIRAQGDNLEATLTADPASVTGDPALLAAMTVTTTISIGGTETSAITDANDGQTVTALVTFVFDEDAGNATQLQNLDLSSLELTLDQNAR